MKLWILTNAPSPYQADFFRALHRSGRHTVAVRFMRGVHRGEPLAADAGFPCRVMKGLGPESWPDELRLHPEAIREAWAGGHDFHVLSGQYTSPTFLACALALRARRRPWGMWLEQPWPEDYRPAWARTLSARSPVARAARRALLRALIRSTDRLLCIGTAAAEAYQRAGAPETKLAVVPYLCETERFALADPAASADVRRRFGLAGRLVFLFSGALIERKGVDVLLAAFQRLAAGSADAALLVLGDGPLRPALEAAVDPGLRDRVRFAGHVAQADLPAHYRAADVFVFPSRHDGWGVVINEACAAGLPVIVTRQTGASRELVRDGDNGFVVERDDAAALYGKMRFFAGRRDELARFGQRSRELIAGYSPDEGVRMFESAIGAAG